MTNRITPDKLTKVSETIEQLNKEMHPLVVKAVLIDPLMVKVPMTEEVQFNTLREILVMIQALLSMVGEQ